MTDADKQLALEADRLRTDPVFQMAVTAARKQAIERLITTNATDTTAIIECQSTIRAIDAMCGELANIILRGTPQRQTPAV